MPPTCKNSQILNPKTKRCINIAGPTCLSVVLAHAAGTIVMSPEDIEKIKAQSTNLWQLYLAPIAQAAPAAPAPVVQPSYIPVAPVAKKKKPAPVIKAPIEVVHIVAPPPVIPAVAKANVPIPTLKWAVGHVASPHKRIFKNAIDRVRKNMSDHYGTKEHELFCNGKGNLDMPDISELYTLNIPIYTLAHTDILSMLDGPPARDKMFRIKKFSLNFNMNSHTQKWLMREGVFGPTTMSFKQFIDESIDMDWIHRQNNYIYNLSLRDISTLLGYSLIGDRLVNNFHRNTFNLDAFHLSLTIGRMHCLFVQFVDEVTTCKYDPIIKGKESVLLKIKLGGKNVAADTPRGWIGKIAGLRPPDQHEIMLCVGRALGLEFWENCIKRYSDDLQRIINAAPRPKKRMTLFRGVKDDYYMNGNKDTDANYLKDGKHFFRNKGFISTSINMETSFHNFTQRLDPKNPQNLCCLKKITVLPGASCLLIVGASYIGHELEILFGKNTVYYMHSQKQLRTYIHPTEKSTCYNSMSKTPVYMADVTIVK